MCVAWLHLESLNQILNHSWWVSQRSMSEGKPVDEHHALGLQNPSGTQIQFEMLGQKASCGLLLLWPCSLKWGHDSHLKTNHLHRPPMFGHSSAYEQRPRGIAKFNQQYTGWLGMLATTYDIPHDTESGRGNPFGSYELVEGSPLHGIFTIPAVFHTQTSCRHIFLPKQMVLDHKVWHCRWRVAELCDACWGTSSKTNLQINYWSIQAKVK